MLYLNTIKVVSIYVKLSSFNFNKCCIWIYLSSDHVDKMAQFNFNKCCIWIGKVIEPEEQKKLI